MSAECCPPNAPPDPRLRRVLWLALILNAAMFAIELVGGFASRSSSLLADAVDFFGDAANYAITLVVLPWGIAWRARAALIKAASMGAYGMGVLAFAMWSAYQGVVPEPTTMSVIGFMALMVNVLVAVLLYSFRTGDSNLRSVWLCSRNDAIGNLAVLAAAAGVFGTGSGWPDIFVAIGMALLAMTASVTVLRQARAELAIAPHTH